jgi:hypothetical protein
MAFVVLKYIPSISNTLYFYHEMILNVHWSIEMIVKDSSFILLMWYIDIIDLLMLNTCCIPEIKPTWSCSLIHLMYYWFQFAGFLFRIFVSMFTNNISMYISSLVVFLSGLIKRCPCLVLCSYLSVPPVWFGGEIFWRVSICFSLNVFYNLAVKPSSTGISFHFSVFVISCNISSFIFSFLSVSFSLLI